MKPIVLLAGLLALSLLGGCAAWRAPGAACALPSAYGPAAAYNAAAEKNLDWSPFGRPERGWAIYSPAIAREVGAACPSDSPAFARAIARWQARASLVPHGGVDPPTFAAMKARWERQRPFKRVRAAGICPDPPDETGLVQLPAADSWRGAQVRLRPAAAVAFERMVAAARRGAPEIAADPALLTAFSGYRSPANDAARCAREHNCDGVVRAACSAHRTGLAVDLNLGPAPGYSPDSSVDANRLYQSRSPAYRWLLANARRFGFVNYAFEPWHWEWTGQAP